MPLLALLFAVFLALLTHPLPARQSTASLTQAPPTAIPSPYPTAKPASAPTDSGPWGVAQRIGEHTYQIRVQNDDQMGTPSEILAALNTLRARHGAQPLTSDNRLCAYAQSRAQVFESLKSTDAHAGFNDLLENQDGFTKLGYRRVGENSSYGYIMSGVHLIEFVYMQSPDHNANQLDPDWDHGCVGVAGSATNLIFATSPL